MLTTDIAYRDYAYLKKLGNAYKLIKCNEVKCKGYEVVDIKKEIDKVYSHNGYRGKVHTQEYSTIDYACENSCNSSCKEHDNEEKLANNICRARNKIIEYVLCNDFEYFVTLTLDSSKYDRMNLKQFNHDFNIFIRDYNKRKNEHIKFLLIPETHQDGAWHLHGFVMGLTKERLKEFDISSEEKLPRYIVDKCKQGYELYSFSRYEEKFGYNIFEPIRNKKASVLYMSKYLTKDISRNVRELGYHLYYCSKGLNKAEIIKQGQFLDFDFDFDFSNQYGAQSFFDSLDDTQIEELKNKIGGNPITLDDYKRGYKKRSDGFREYVDVDTGEIISDKYKECEVFSDCG